MDTTTQKHHSSIRMWVGGVGVVPGLVGPVDRRWWGSVVVTLDVAAVFCA